MMLNTDSTRHRQLLMLGKRSNENIEVNIVKNSIENTSEEKLLGATIHNKQTFETHSS